MINKLFIIGNGFDLWCGLPTSLSSFKKYYYENRDSLMKNLNVKHHEIYNDCGKIEKLLTDVEFIYQNPFSLEELGEEFWFNFEEEMGNIDVDSINFFFGKEDDELEELHESVESAKLILAEAFVSWIKSIHTEKKTSRFVFNESCEFLNFNYTDTLQKFFDVPYESVYYIHGEADDKESIIFGHDSHPEPPPFLAYELGGRFQGLYFIEYLLYDTDKHIDENIEMYITYLSLKGIMPNDIKDVYVLGHSFGTVDFKYFKFLVSATRASAHWHISCYNEDDEKRVKDTMAKLDFKKYNTYKSIDECINAFRIV